MEMHTYEMIHEAVARKLGISFMFREECPPDQRLKILEIHSASKTLDVNGYLAVQSERRKKIPAVKRALEIAKKIAAASGA